MEEKKQKKDNSTELDFVNEITKEEFKKTLEKVSRKIKSAKLEEKVK